MDASKKISLRSEEVQEILTAIPSWMILWGNSLILIVLMLLLAISWFVKYPDVIISESIITTQQAPQKEYAKISGKIDTFLVPDRQYVAAHTPVAIIENSANFKDVFLLKSILDSIRPQATSFNFPIDYLPLLTLGEIEGDFALLENSYDQYLLNKQLQPHSDEALANKNTLEELLDRLKNVELQLEISSEELVFKKSELERSKLLFEQGVIAAQAYESSQMENLQARRNHKNIQLSISQIKESIAKARLTSSKTNISQTKEDRVLFRHVIQSYNQLKKAIKEWELKYVLKTSISGEVSFLDYWTHSKVVNVGDLVFIIIPPEHKGYIAKLKAPAQNFGKIKVGQAVFIKVDNYPHSEFGMLAGQVENISLISDKDGFYTVDVLLPNKLLTTYQQEIEFRQEMKGVAEIITEDLRLIERLFYQFRSIIA